WSWRTWPIAVSVNYLMLADQSRFASSNRFRWLAMPSRRPWLSFDLERPSSACDTDDDLGADAMSTRRVVACPNCSQTYSLTEAHMGRTIRCRVCTNEFAVGVDGTITPSSAKQEKIGR